MSVLWRVGRGGKPARTLYLRTADKKIGLEMSAPGTSNETSLKVNVFRVGFGCEEIPLPREPRLAQDKDQNIIFHDERRATESRRIRLDNQSGWLFVAHVRVGSAGSFERLVALPQRTWMTLLVGLLAMGVTAVASGVFMHLWHPDPCADGHCSTNIAADADADVAAEDKPDVRHVADVLDADVMDGEDGDADVVDAPQGTIPVPLPTTARQNGASQPSASTKCLFGKSRDAGTCPPDLKKKCAPAPEISNAQITVYTCN